MKNILVVLFIIVIIIFIIVRVIRYFKLDRREENATQGSTGRPIIKLPCKKNFIERNHSNQKGITHERKHPNMKHSHISPSFDPYQKGITHERKRHNTEENSLSSVPQPDEFLI